jgi:hypothetical protein
MLLFDVGEQGGITQIGLSTRTLVITRLDTANEVFGKRQLRVHRGTRINNQ